jgi:hypothetical protein
LQTLLREVHGMEESPSHGAGQVLQPHPPAHNEQLETDEDIAGQTHGERYLRLIMYIFISINKSIGLFWIPVIGWEPEATHMDQSICR